jgi:glutamyl-Q tRNA(Asp) synthetase
VSAARNSTATGTIATAEDRRGGYVGRFAPSPTGELHQGSLFTAVASHLDARANHGRWLVRIEDLDRPREVPGAGERILATLAAFGFEWPEPVVYQSRREEAYRQALASLASRSLVYHCRCSRRDLADEERYPGTCRDLHLGGETPTALRLRVPDGPVSFIDRIHGEFRQSLAQVGGDFVLRRRDGLVAYVLAVVVDDAAQGVTDVVRGADLLDDTPRQVLLQRLLGLPTPRYAHVPLLVEADGAKLAKSRRSVPVDPQNPVAQLCQVFAQLGLEPPSGLQKGSLAGAWAWATAQWPRRLSGRPFPLSLAADPRGDLDVR